MSSICRLLVLLVGLASYGTGCVALQDLQKGLPNTAELPGPLQSLAESQHGQAITLISNQESTEFFGRVISDSKAAFIVGKGVQREGRAGGAPELLGQGKFVDIHVHPQGIYEITARPPGYREKGMTAAPPFNARLSFTFEVSDKVADKVRLPGDGPTIEIESPPDGGVVDENTIVLVGKITTKSGISRVEIFVNGKKLDAARGLRSDATQPVALNEEITLAEGPNTISVNAYDSKQALAQSVRSVVRGKPLSQVVSPPVRTIKPPFLPRYNRRIAATIGIDDYEKWPRLEGAVNDARAMAATLRELGFDEIIEVYDRDATRQGILTRLGTKLKNRTTREDLVVIYFAGHGQTETLPNQEKRGYIIPTDGDTAELFATAISMQDLRELSNQLGAKHVYYVMDSCYSGLGFVRGMAPQAKTEGYISKMISTPVVQMLTAGGENEESYEHGGHGLFTSFMIRALKGEADSDGDGAITASEIGVFVRPQVTAGSNNKQTPQFGTIEGRGEVIFLGE